MGGRLDNKVTIITGGATGIGEAIAHKFAHEGASVVVSGLPDDPVEDVVQAILEKGGSAIGYKGDVSDEEQAQACVQAAIDHWGRLDVLINNAGVFLVTAELDNYPVEDFDRTLRMNLRSAFLMTKFALPHLRKSRGNIVAAGSEAGYNGLPMNAPYGGTKGFMHSFIMGVAVEQAKYGVRANCVCPGAIDTAWTHKETGPMDAKMEQQLVTAAPLGRRGTPEEMANIYAFLASDEASYVTGALWLADGGVTPAKGPVGAEAKGFVKQEPSGEIGHPLEHERDGLRNKEYHTIR
jgi:NAD(P)-dependent dehydrogenase (short-subunit alcohol dehydrogenase family)